MSLLPQTETHKQPEGAKVRLIVNADDYGRTPGVSAGIREAHRHGIVTSTTAMMNMPGIERELRAVQEKCPHLGLGVHLLLTVGGPLLPAEQVRSLSDESGAFFWPKELAGRLSALAYGEVVAEWRAQVERFIALTGAPPDHLDAHHHVAYWTPLLLRAMLELAREYSCAIRLPTGAEAERVGMDVLAGRVQPLSVWAGPLLAEFRPRHPDRFDPSFYGPGATRERLLALLAGLPPGTTELMCHPGRGDAELLAASGYNRQREVELDVLTDPGVLKELSERGVELISFAQMA
jgi:predicted glycoside hydrolase/deacetylase ChbG (UPF0249 family)